MSDYSILFHNMTHEDEEMQCIWATRNRLLGLDHYGANALSEMNLNEDDMNRILTLLTHPLFESTMDAVIQMYTAKHKSKRKRAAHRARRHELLLELYRNSL